MRKVLHRRWYVLILFGLILLAGLLAAFMIPDVLAAGSDDPGPERPGECTVEHVQPAFGDTVVVNNGEVICSNLTSWGSNIIINGDVRGNVVAFGGNVIVDGKVHGTIRSYAGNVTLRNGARVYGDIHLCGGQRTQNSASQLYGSVFDCPRSIELLLAGDGGAGFRFWSLLTWVALGIILTSLLPEHVMLVRTTARSKMRRSLLLGVLS
ncbi:MAG TPA: polymer-forming cytoskeletal protein, partial [Ktedonobacteraceae bacterium]